jgi:hypothetical protein
MLDSDEKRSYHRMRVDCPASFRLADERTPGGAIVKNLSGGGGSKAACAVRELQVSAPPPHPTPRARPGAPPCCGPSAS